METNQTTQEKNCYSPEELQMFKEIILKKREEAMHNLELLNEAVAGSANDVHDTAPTFKTVEDDGAFQLSKEEAGALAQRQYKFIQNLEAALVRIENKTYGICRVTGKLIPKERLRLVPHATTTVEGKAILEKTGRK